MLNMRYLAIASLAFSMIGCGGGTSNPPASTPPMSGTLVLNVTSQMHPKTDFIFGQVQTDAHGSVTGTLHVSVHNDPNFPESDCFVVIASDFPVSGTMKPQTNGEGQLDISGTFNSFPGGNLTITVEGTVSADGQTLSLGSFQLSGTLLFCNNQGTVTGFLIQPFTGGYSGTFSLTTGTVSVSGALAQEATSDHGQFHFNDTTFQVVDSTPCGLGTVNPNLDTNFSFATGAVIQLIFPIVDMNGQKIGSVGFNGAAMDGSAKVIPGTLTIGTNNCALGGPGTLVRP